MINNEAKVGRTVDRAVGRLEQSTTYSAELVEAALAAPWHRLTFPAAVERKFEADSRAERRRERRRIVLIGLLLFLAFLPSDAQIIPDIFQLSVVLRFGFTAASLIAYMLVNMPKVPVWLQELTLPIFTVVCVIILISLFLLTKSPYQASCLDGLILVIMYGNLCSSAPFRYVTYSSLACAIVIVTGISISPLPYPVAQTYTIVALSSIGLTLVTLHRLERQHRHSYLKRCLDVFKNEAESERAQEEAARELQRQVSADRVATLAQLSADFEARIKHSAEFVIGVASLIYNDAIQASQIAAATEQQSSAAAANVQRNLDLLQTAASAAKDLLATSITVQQQSSNAAEAAADAVSRVQQSTSALAELNDNTRQIDAIVGLIAAIAKQSQLLALNATIEAARAGRAGAGFSVVANEVKRLAAQTGAATLDVARKVSGIQAAVAALVRAGTSVQKSVEVTHGLTLEIAEAMGKQNEATTAISEASATVAELANKNALRIYDAANHADETLKTTKRMRQNAEALNRDAQTLQTETNGFVVKLRAV